MGKKTITRDNWMSSFTLIGVAKVNDFTFKLDEKSEKSSWCYNSLNLGIDCGEKHGVVYTELMGGYGIDSENVIYAHGKKDDGSDDFDQQIQVAWDDRNNEEVLENIGDLCFLTVGLETTSKGKTYYKKFLSAYDAIAYINEHLEDGTVVNVRGTLRYSVYNDNVQVRKTIQSIVLSKVDDVSKYGARFTQTLLLNSESAALKGDHIDKDRGVMFVDARVLDYVKEIDGVEIKGQYPFKKTFEYQMDFTKPEVCKKIMEKVFKIRKDVTQITFEGMFVEGGAVVTATLDDIPDDIKDLIECGVYTEEEALARCSTSGAREQHMILTKPYIRMIDGKPVLQRFDGKYTEDDLRFDLPDDDEDEDDGVAPWNGADDTGDAMDWLNALE